MNSTDLWLLTEAEWREGTLTNDQAYAVFSALRKIRAQESLDSSKSDFC